MPLARMGRSRFLTEFTLSHRRVRNDTPPVQADRWKRLDRYA